jgi:hypothetical protein
MKISIPNCFAIPKRAPNLFSIGEVSFIRIHPWEDSHGIRFRLDYLNLKGTIDGMMHLHRLDGPAISLDGAAGEFWLRGQQQSKLEFLKTVEKCLADLG